MDQISILQDLKTRITGPDGHLLDRNTIEAELDKAIASEQSKNHHMSMVEELRYLAYEYIPDTPCSGCSINKRLKEILSRSTTEASSPTTSESIVAELERRGISHTCLDCVHDREPQHPNPICFACKEVSLMSLYEKAK